MPSNVPPFHRIMHPHDNDQLLWGVFLALFDIIIISVAARLNFLLVYGDDMVPLIYALATSAFILITLITSYVYGAYQSWAKAPLSREFRAILSGWMVSISIILLLAFTLKSSASFSRIWFISTLLSALTSIFVVRALFRHLLNKVKGSAWNRTNILIIGAQPHGLSIAHKITAALWPNTQVKGFFDDTKNDDMHGEITLLGKIKDLEQYLDKSFKQDTLKTNQNNRIHQVWITLPANHPKKNELLSIIDQFSLDSIYVPEPYFSTNIPQKLTSIAGIPAITLSAVSLRNRQKVVKFLQDIILSSIILILISPLMALIAIGIKLTSPGPIFFQQQRMTFGGKIFKILKFRSMPHGTEKKSGPVNSTKYDNRATKFGDFLRHTSLDELPQFINVLKGEMSIVGPRPERPFFVEQYKKEIPSYMKKHLLKAGITGWAQINGYRGDTDLNKRIELDLYYIENWSTMFDLKIIFKSIYKGFIN